MVVRERGGVLRGRVAGQAVGAGRIRVAGRIGAARVPLEVAVQVDLPALRVGAGTERGQLAERIHRGAGRPDRPAGHVRRDGLSCDFAVVIAAALTGAGVVGERFPEHAPGIADCGPAGRRVREASGQHRRAFAVGQQAGERRFAVRLVLVRDQHRRRAAGVGRDLEHAAERVVTAQADEPRGRIRARQQIAAGRPRIRDDAVARGRPGELPAPREHAPGPVVRDRLGQAGLPGVALVDLHLPEPAGEMVVLGRIRSVAVVVAAHAPGGRRRRPLRVVGMLLKLRAVPRDGTGAFLDHAAQRVVFPVGDVAAVQCIAVGEEAHQPGAAVDDLRGAAVGIGRAEPVPGEVVVGGAAAGRHGFRAGAACRVRRGRHRRDGAALRVVNLAHAPVEAVVGERVLHDAADQVLGRVRPALRDRAVGIDVRGQVILADRQRIGEAPRVGVDAVAARRVMRAAGPDRIVVAGLTERHRPAERGVFVDRARERIAAGVGMPRGERALERRALPEAAVGAAVGHQPVLIDEQRLCAGHRDTARECPDRGVAAIVVHAGVEHRAIGRFELQRLQAAREAIPILDAQADVLGHGQRREAAGLRHAELDAERGGDRGVRIFEHLEPVGEEQHAARHGHQQPFPCGRRAAVGLQQHGVRAVEPPQTPALRRAEADEPGAGAEHRVAEAGAVDQYARGDARRRETGAFEPRAERPGRFAVIAEQPAARAPVGRIARRGRVERQRAVAETVVYADPLAVDVDRRVRRGARKRRGRSDRRVLRGEPGHADQARIVPGADRHGRLGERVVERARAHAVRRGGAERAQPCAVVGDRLELAVERREEHVVEPQPRRAARRQFGPNAERDGGVRAEAERRRIDGPLLRLPLAGGGREAPAQLRAARRGERQRHGEVARGRAGRALEPEAEQLPRAAVGQRHGTGERRRRGDLQAGGAAGRVVAIDGGAGRQAPGRPLVILETVVRIAARRIDEAGDAKACCIVEQRSHRPAGDVVREQHVALAVARVDTLLQQPARAGLTAVPRGERRRVLVDRDPAVGFREIGGAVVVRPVAEGLRLRGLQQPAAVRLHPRRCAGHRREDVRAPHRRVDLETEQRRALRDVELAPAVVIGSLDRSRIARRRVVRIGHGARDALQALDRRRDLRHGVVEIAQRGAVRVARDLVGVGPVAGGGRQQRAVAVVHRTRQQQAGRQRVRVVDGRGRPAYAGADAAIVRQLQRPRGQAVVEMARGPAVALRLRRLARLVFGHRRELHDAARRIGVGRHVRVRVAAQHRVVAAVHRERGHDEGRERRMQRVIRIAVQRDVGRCVDLVARREGHEPRRNRRQLARNGRLVVQRAVEQAEHLLPGKTLDHRLALRVAQQPAVAEEAHLRVERRTVGVERHEREEVRRLVDDGRAVEAIDGDLAQPEAGERVPRGPDRPAVEVAVLRQERAGQRREALRLAVRGRRVLVLQHLGDPRRVGVGIETVERGVERRRRVLRLQHAELIPRVPVELAVRVAAGRVLDAGEVVGPAHAVEHQHVRARADQAVAGDHRAERLHEGRRQVREARAVEYVGQRAQREVAVVVVPREHGQAVVESLHHAARRRIAVDPRGGREALAHRQLEIRRGADRRNRDRVGVQRAAEPPRQRRRIADHQAEAAARRVLVIAEHQIVIGGRRHVRLRIDAAGRAARAARERGRDVPVARLPVQRVAVDAAIVVVDHDEEVGAVGDPQLRAVVAVRRGRAGLAREMPVRVRDRPARREIERRLRVVEVGQQQHEAVGAGRGYRPIEIERAVEALPVRPGRNPAAQPRVDVHQQRVLAGLVPGDDHVVGAVPDARRARPAGAERIVDGEVARARIDVLVRAHVDLGVRVAQHAAGGQRHRRHRARVRRAVGIEVVVECDAGAGRAAAEGIGHPFQIAFVAGAGGERIGCVARREQGQVVPVEIEPGLLRARAVDHVDVVEIARLVTVLPCVRLVARRLGRVAVRGQVFLRRVERAGVVGHRLPREPARPAEIVFHARDLAFARVSQRAVADRLLDRAVRKFDPVPERIAQLREIPRERVALLVFRAAARADPVAPADAPLDQVARGGGRIRAAVSGDRAVRADDFPAVPSRVVRDLPELVGRRFIGLAVGGHGDRAVRLPAQQVRAAQRRIVETPLVGAAGGRDPRVAGRAPAVSFQRGRERRRHAVAREQRRGRGVVERVGGQRAAAPRRRDRHELHRLALAHQVILDVERAARTLRFRDDAFERHAPAHAERAARVREVPLRDLVRDVALVQQGQVERQPATCRQRQQLERKGEIAAEQVHGGTEAAGVELEHAQGGDVGLLAGAGGHGDSSRKWSSARTAGGGP
ncbi:hypothetical protein BCCR75501_06391 [Burkholderia sola]|nr:hypothetical protein BCCR75501_06391 [Burkholderia cenocepacia]